MIGKSLKIRGISLVEVLVSAAIILVVFSMAINIYIHAKDMYVSHKQGTDKDVKQLYIKRVIYNFIKNAGFACRFGDQNQTYYDKTEDSLTDYFSNSSSVILGPLPFSSGSSFSASMKSGCSGSECYQSGTDFIMIKKEGINTSLTASNISNTTLSVVSASGIDEGDYLALCDKDYINILKAGSVDNGTNTITSTQAPSGSIYYSGDYLGTYSLQVLYIRGTGDQDDDGNEIYSLYVYIKDNSSNDSYELVRGVKDLQLEYPTVSNGNITWNEVTSDIGVDSLGYPALKAIFDVDGETFSKIIVL